MRSRTNPRTPNHSPRHRTINPIPRDPNTGFHTARRQSQKKTRHPRTPKNTTHPTETEHKHQPPINPPFRDHDASLRQSPTPIPGTDT
ncbi:hypothetical protein GCM10009555_014510 [Acrocarpospora macrocephala]|uniref:Uncharacterized protein n=1 Tax=Acrocarpospora macrocephala TaxID=150177 RepID=A0A5M3WPT9_9ACTN|nr:hypothetical protein Amac_018540 [Acrocarpospora macrocephala]